MPAKGRVKRPRNGPGGTKLFAVFSPTVQDGKRSDEVRRVGSETTELSILVPVQELIRAFPSLDALDLRRTTSDGGVRRESASSSACHPIRVAGRTSFCASSDVKRKAVSDSRCPVIFAGYHARLWATTRGSLDALLYERVRLLTHSLESPRQQRHARGSCSLAHLVPHIASHRR